MTAQETEHGPFHMTYRLFVNDTRTVLVRLWDNDTMEVATRETPAHTWGPPIYLTEEKVA